MKLCGRSAAIILTCLWQAVAAIAPPFAQAGTPERDKAWDALIAEAKAHGAEESKLDKSASYVFRREDGSYLTLTRLLATDAGRSVCLINKEETATACIDWDTRKLKLGKRADAASPWKFFSFASLDEFEAARPGVLEKIGDGLQWLIRDFGKHGQSGACYRLSKNGNWYRVPRMNC